MHAVNDSGVGFSLDNFGAGFASLVYLRRLPLARLKVDQAMVQAALSDSGVAVIARAIVALGVSLGLPVLAEGVETAAQLDYFASVGCSHFQATTLPPRCPRQRCAMTTQQTPASAYDKEIMCFLEERSVAAPPALLARPSDAHGALTIWAAQSTHHDAPP